MGLTEGSLKVGYAGQNFPTFQYPSIVGTPILRAEERGNTDVVRLDLDWDEDGMLSRDSPLRIS